MMGGEYARPLARGVAALTLAAGLAMVVACGGAPTTEGAERDAGTPKGEARTHAPKTVGPQPSLAPKSARVDLAEPTFSDPTSITNPLFQVNDLTQVVQLGKEAGEPVRFEVTLLPWTKTIEWNGQQVETLVRQYIAYGNGRILEFTLDYFAQADDGSVWYFGEDVDNDGAFGTDREVAGLVKEDRERVAPISDRVVGRLPRT